MSRLCNRLFLVFVLSLAGCGQSTTTKNKSISTRQNVTGVTDYYVDTLRTPSNYYFLSDLPLRHVAQLILADSISPIDNKITFDCLDSLSSSSKEARNYYFPVFLKILEKSDGALSEVIGQYSMDFVEKYPMEFAAKSVSLADVQFREWASYTGQEFYFSGETEKKAQEWTKSIISACSSCDTIQVSRLEKFGDLVIAAIRDYRHNDVQ